MKEAGIIFKCS